MKADSQELYKQLPGVDKLLEDNRIQKLTERFPRMLVVEGIRNYLDSTRQAIAREDVGVSINFDDIVDALIIWAEDSLNAACSGL